jgi:hypothetical protein
MAKVTIGTYTFYTPSDPREGTIEPAPPDVKAQSFSLEGGHRRLDNPLVQRLVFDNWAQMGIGWSHMRRRTGRGVSGFRDSDALTLHDSGIYLGILNESQTHASPADHPKSFLNFKGDFWGLFEEDYASGAITDVVCRKWGATSDNWTGGGTVKSGASNAHGQRVFDAVIHKGKITVLVSQDSAEQDWDVADSPDGASFTAYTNPPQQADTITTTITRRNNFDDDEGKLFSDGNTLLAAMRNSVDATHIDIRSTADQGGSAWTDEYDINADTHVHAFLRWVDPTDTSASIPIVVTERNIYKIDISASAPEPLLPDGVLDGDPNTGRGARVGLDGHLYIPFGSGMILAIGISSERSFVFEYIEPPDGLVVARQGHVNALLVVPRPYLVVAYGGHAANKTASIFTMSYESRPVPGDPNKRFRTWHSLYSEANANIDLYLLGYSTEDDVTERLHFALEHASSAEMYHLELPFNDPATGVAQKFQSSSFVEWAEDDLGDPHSNGNVLRGRVDADDLSSADDGEYIEHEYGLNGAAWNNVSNFGNYVSGDKELQFGRTLQNVTDQTEAGTSIGVSAKTIRHRLALNRASTNTNTPRVKEFEVETENIAATLRGILLPVDIGLTAEQTGLGSADNVHADIEACVDTVTLQALDYAKAATTNVRVKEVQRGNIFSAGLAESARTEERGGIRWLHCYEPIDTS